MRYREMPIPLVPCAYIVNDVGRSEEMHLQKVFQHVKGIVMLDARVGRNMNGIPIVFTHCSPGIINHEGVLLGHVVFTLWITMLLHAPHFAQGFNVGVLDASLTCPYEMELVLGVVLAVEEVQDERGDWMYPWVISRGPYGYSLKSCKAKG